MYKKLENRPGTGPKRLAAPALASIGFSNRFRTDLQRRKRHAGANRDQLEKRPAGQVGQAARQVQRKSEVGKPFLAFWEPFAGVGGGVGNSAEDPGGPSERIGGGGGAVRDFACDRGRTGLGGGGRSQKKRRAARRPRRELGNL